MNKPIITLSNVYKSFEDKHVLQGLDLTIYAGETFVILGPSGCGKSVSLKIITGLLKPDAGNIFVKDKCINSMNERELNNIRMDFGMLFQNAALFDSLTVGENVSFGLKEHGNYSKNEIAEIVEEKLSMVGLPGISAKMPSELSGGMRKRVGLARAIALKPKIIFYDEPTTGLDPIMSTEIDMLVLKLQQELKVTSVVITHDMKSAFRIADRVGLHYEGKLWEVSTPQEFQQSENPFVQKFIRGEPQELDDLSKETNKGAKK
ncbi:MAG: ABC transporter ATP-binding protein [bacterium]|nr:ABC transporter ATP-binding protein [bacterium]